MTIWLLLAILPTITGWLALRPHHPHADPRRIAQLEHELLDEPAPPAWMPSDKPGQVFEYQPTHTYLSSLTG